MLLYESEFKRRFAACLFKNKRLLLGEMEFNKDFVNSDRGDKYPVLFSSDDYKESVINGEYVFSSAGGELVRLMGGFTPFASYEVVIFDLKGECGFYFGSDKKRVIITLCRDDNGLSVIFVADGKEEKLNLDFDNKSPVLFSVQNRREYFDVYINDKNFYKYIATFIAPGFNDCSFEDVFSSLEAGVYFKGDCRIKNAACFFDSGVSMADMRMVKYENGEVVFENGRVYFTASVRLQAGGYQGVFSWIPGTEEISLTGVLFFDTGDGEWCSDVASSLIFNRKTEKWLIWFCSFSHGHILGFSEFIGEPRFGKNVIDVTLVDKLSAAQSDFDFGGKEGDEDPDLIFDEKSEKWYMAVCRHCSETGKYRYYFFTSASPFGPFEYYGRGVPGSETGGSFVPFGGELNFVCGNSFELHSDYRIYNMNDLSSPKKLVCDYPDGGFRGWGTVFSLDIATRKKLYWLTFDRHCASDFNWSYGNIYCYEAKVK